MMEMRGNSSKRRNAAEAAGKESNTGTATAKEDRPKEESPGRREKSSKPLEEVQLFTIGFAKKPAEKFFGMLTEAGVQCVVDIRLNNVSQLAGFTKRDDLRYFLRAICGIGYEHLLELAPTKEILDNYRAKGGNWQTYENDFIELIADRRIEDSITKKLLHRSCLLCSEEAPEHCHRRLVAEYLREKWEGVEITHLT